MASVIRLENLSKTYGRGNNAVQAVNQLSLDIEPGQIYGFLGPNGAGKTTTIRMLLDLIHPTAGQVYLFDTPVKDAARIRQRNVGALVEEATMYPSLTGYDNLRTVAYFSDFRDEKRIMEVLELVGMTAFAKRKAKTYSTGMKQRLGVAAALLHDPELLILDEPTSGLDPKGNHEMRDMFKYLVKNEGKTIFLSSHLLHEVEQICDHVAIIRKGELVREGSVADLVSESGKIVMETERLSQALTLLSDHYSVQIIDKKLHIMASRDKIPSIVESLVSNGHSIYEVKQERRTLEDLFLEVTV